MKVIILSYPKSGRTWLKVLIEQYCNRCGVKKPSIAWSHIGHGMIPEYPPKNLDCPTVLLTRNYPDTLVSYFHDDSVRNKKKVSGKTIDEYVKDNLPDIKTFYDTVSKKNIFLTLEYEKMVDNTYPEVLPLFAFLFDDQVDVKCLRKAIDFCSFENLSAMERNKSIDMRVAPSHMGKGFYKTRKGQIGSAEEELKPKTLQFLKDNLK